MSPDPTPVGSNEQPRWLNITFGVTLVAILGMGSVAMVQEAARPVTFEQRLVPALGVVDRCEGCHDAEAHPGEALAQHPVEKFGCTPCHGGQGLATTKEAAHERSPDWEWPLHEAAEREAACGACHLGWTVEGAPVLSRGRAAIDERSCAGCHEIPGYAAPDYPPQLDGLASKVTPGWVRAWLRDPAALNSVHRMPTFALPDDKREALIAFLFSVPGPALVDPAQPDALVDGARAAMDAAAAGDPDRGRRAVSERRCATCHKIGERGGTTATDLGWAGAKLSPAWLYSYLLDTHRVRPLTRMPGFQLPEAEAADIVAFAAEQWVPDTSEPAWAKDEAPVRTELAETGRTLFVDLGCAGCHAVTGVERTRISVSLGTIGSRRIADMPKAAWGALPDLPGWIATKVTQPHAFDASAGAPALMPAFVGMEPEEALAIGVALTSLRANPPPEAYLVRPEGAASSLPAGETGRLVTRYRCLVCHSIGGEGGSISRVPLDGEGARVRHDWLVGFLQSPVTIRMDQAERMPILGITADEAARLATWMEDSLGDARIPDGATLGDAARGRARFDDLGCPTCHVVAGQGTMAGPVLDAAGDRLAPDYVVALLTVGATVVPGGRHPPATYTPADAGDLAAFILSLHAPAAP